MRRDIRRALVAAAKVEAVADGTAVAVLVCGDQEMRGFNQRFAGLDETTDVLAFPGAPPELGDIILSLDRLKAQAEAAGHSLEREAMTLVVHGFLHLLGYDHARASDKRVMWRRTEQILASIDNPG